MNGLYSPFKLEHSWVSDFKLEQNKLLIKDNQIKINYNIEYMIDDIIKEDNLEIGGASIFISIEGISDKLDSLLKINLIMKGIFFYDASELLNRDVEYPKFPELLKINGVSNLIQLCRAYLTSITSLSGFPAPIYLPMVNVYNLKERVK